MDVRFSKERIFATTNESSLMVSSEILCSVMTPSCSVAHNLILAHAYAVKLYREESQPTQQGTIGITLDSGWYMPYDEGNESQSSFANYALIYHRSESIRMITEDVEAVRQAFAARLGKVSAFSRP